MLDRRPSPLAIASATLGFLALPPIPVSAQEMEESTRFSDDRGSLSQESAANRINDLAHESIRGEFNRSQFELRHRTIRALEQENLEFLQKIEKSYPMEGRSLIFSWRESIACGARIADLGERTTSSEYWCFVKVASDFEVILRNVLYQQDEFKWQLPGIFRAVSNSVKVAKECGSNSDLIEAVEKKIVEIKSLRERVIGGDLRPLFSKELVVMYSDLARAMTDLTNEVESRKRELAAINGKVSEDDQSFTVLALLAASACLFSLNLLSEYKKRREVQQK